MAYVKTTWQTGDVITAEKLNHAEGGIEAHDPFIVIESDTDTGTALNKTWQEINDALMAGKYCPVWYLYEDVPSNQVGVIISAQALLNTYVVNMTEGSTGVQYIAQSADGYPSHA